MHFGFALDWWNRGFVRYRFVKYWFRFVSRPWFHTDFPVNILFISETSSRRLQDMSWRRPQCMSSRRLQDVFSETIFCLPRRLEDVFKTSLRRPQDVFPRCLEDVFEDEKLLRWRCVEHVLKTMKCLLGYLYSTKTITRSY